MERVVLNKGWERKTYTKAKEGQTGKNKLRIWRIFWNKFCHIVSVQEFYLTLTSHNVHDYGQLSNTEATLQNQYYKSCAKWEQKSGLLIAFSFNQEEIWEKETGFVFPESI